MQLVHELKMLSAYRNMCRSERSFNWRFKSGLTNLLTIININHIITSTRSATHCIWWQSTLPDNEVNHELSTFHLQVPMMSHRYNCLRQYFLHLQMTKIIISNKSRNHTQLHLVNNTCGQTKYSKPLDTKTTKMLKESDVQYKNWDFFWRKEQIWAKCLSCSSDTLQVIKPKLSTY